MYSPTDIKMCSYTNVYALYMYTEIPSLVFSIHYLAKRPSFCLRWRVSPRPPRVEELKIFILHGFWGGGFWTNPFWETRNIFPKVPGKSLETLPFFMIDQQKSQKKTSKNLHNPIIQSSNHWMSWPNITSAKPLGRLFLMSQGATCWILFSLRPSSCSTWRSSGAQGVFCPLKMVVPPPLFGRNTMKYISDPHVYIGVRKWILLLWSYMC